jgi:hypothetical protein
VIRGIRGIRVRGATLDEQEEDQLVEIRVIRVIRGLIVVRISRGAT